MLGRHLKQSYTWRRTDGLWHTHFSSSSGWLC